MKCIGPLRRALIALGLSPNPSDVEVKEAETDNLVVDRQRVMEELAEHGAAFKERSQALSFATDKRKKDLSELLGHITRINNSSASARTLLQRLIDDSEGGDTPFR